MTDIFSSDYTEDNIKEILYSTPFKLFARGSTFIIFTNKNKTLILKIAKPFYPFKSKASDTFQKKGTPNNLINLINRYKHYPIIIRLKFFFKEVCCFIKFRKSLISIFSDFLFDSYRLGIENLSDNSIKTKIINDISIRKLKLADILPSDFTIYRFSKIIIQEFIDKKNFLINKIIDHKQQWTKEIIEKHIEKVFVFQKNNYWSKRIFDLDRGIDIFNNYIITSKGQTASHDLGYLSQEWEEILPMIKERYEYACQLKNKIALNQNDIVGTILREQMAPSRQLLTSLINVFDLISDTKLKDVIAITYIDAIIKYYNPDYLSAYWKK